MLELYINGYNSKSRKYIRVTYKRLSITQSPKNILELRINPPSYIRKVYENMPELYINALNYIGRPIKLCQSYIYNIHSQLY